MTYCENISDNEVALHCTPEEMALMWDLLNSISHPAADRLRLAIEKEVRSFGGFDIHRISEVELCKNCKASGNIKVSTWPANYDHKIETCSDCRGVGRRIKITSWRYEILSKDKKLEMAPEPVSAINKT